MVPNSARHGSKVLEVLSNIEVPEFKIMQSIQDDAKHSNVENGAGTAARSLPSTRAGGPDDVSLEKLPQMILLWDCCDIAVGVLWSCCGIAVSLLLDSCGIAVGFLRY